MRQLAFGVSMGPSALEERRRPSGNLIAGEITVERSKNAREVFRGEAKLDPRSKRSLCVVTVAASSTARRVRGSAARTDDETGPADLSIQEAAGTRSVRPRQRRHECGARPELRVGVQVTTRAEVASTCKRAGVWGTEASPTGTLQSMSVAGLVEAARDGDARAWEELVARFGGMVAATGRRFGLSAPDVAEVQQTTWLRLVENIHRIEQPECVGGWLATTARRECLQLATRAAKYRTGADQMLTNMPNRHEPEPDDRLIAEEREAVVRAAWARLRPRRRELISLFMTEDRLGYKEISKLMKMPIGSIGPTRARCLQQLRRFVEDEGIAGL